MRRDGDDPYLVVAADKGTATFSDIANAISIEYGHWLGDAFASGGSAGYDHKGMGITARGAWECVKRHFREMGMDIQSQDFTCAGVGDMSGDVFGNGMLLSKHIRLVAAFDHRHIFIDPNPDAAAELPRARAPVQTTALELGRLLAQARFRAAAACGRAARSPFRCPPKSRALLGIDAPAATPVEVMRAILRMPVDLLWNGGIGTYVKAHDESHAEVRDRANDAIRANGREMRARVIGEGGNLGCTQRGRVEYAQFGGPDKSGGRINTDFIDNSAGVNTSDLEVNIKILLADVTRKGRLTLAARNRLLASMTDEVAALVLRNNYLQSQAISVRRAARRRTSRRIPGPGARAGARRLPQSRHRVPAGGRRVPGAPQAAPRTHTSRDRRGAGVQQDLAQQSLARFRPAGRSVLRRRSAALLSRAACASAMRARSRATA